MRVAGESCPAGGGLTDEYESDGDPWLSCAPDISVRFGRCALALLAMGVAVLVSPGCGGGGDKERETAFEPVPDELIDDPRFGVYPADRVDAVLGMPMVILVELAGGYLPEDIGAVRLDDGRELESEVVWFGVSAQPASGQWLDPAGVWRVRTLDGCSRAEGLAPRAGHGRYCLTHPSTRWGRGCGSRVVGTR